MAVAVGALAAYGAEYLGGLTEVVIPETVPVIGGTVWDGADLIAVAGIALLFMNKVPAKYTLMAAAVTGALLGRMVARVQTQKAAG